MLYCDCADGLVRITSVDKFTGLQAVPDDREPGGTPMDDVCGVGGWGQTCSGLAMASSSSAVAEILACAGCTLTSRCAPRSAGAQDGVLRWFEAFAEALSAGRFAVEALEADYPESVGISLFPQLPPWRSEAVTEARLAGMSAAWVPAGHARLACFAAALVGHRGSPARLLPPQGVRVRACPLFVPELTQINDAERSYFFAYSIRFDLLSEEEQAALQGSLAGPRNGPMPSVQLRSRHWLIRNTAGAVESEVRGEAVVGRYPLLRAGGSPNQAACLEADLLPVIHTEMHAGQPAVTCPGTDMWSVPLSPSSGEPCFAYQSCTHQKELRGSMEGSFGFVEGSLEHPRREFDVACARFSLEVPDVMF